MLVVEVYVVPIPLYIPSIRLNERFHRLLATFHQASRPVADTPIRCPTISFCLFPLGNPATFFFTMSSRWLQLVCTIFAFSIIHSSSAQATSTGTENGIISAAGGPAATRSISYSIEGLPAATLTSSASMTTVTPPSTSDSSPMSGEGTELASSSDQGFSVPAILGITLAVLVAVLAIIIIVFVLYRKRRQIVGRAKRKSIMDVEFAAESKANLHRVNRAKSVQSTRSANIGYFDVAKPLPAVVAPVEDDRLSRSSTIIGDAAEIAQINRKASSHQRRQKQSREAVRERNHALQILITSEDNTTSLLPASPLTSDPSTPVESKPKPQAECRDNDGDNFARRPSKI